MRSFHRNLCFTAALALAAARAAATTAAVVTRPTRLRSRPSPSTVPRSPAPSLMAAPIRMALTTSTTWAWDFGGDGTVGRSRARPTPLRADGTYDVALTVTDAGGATNSVDPDRDGLDHSDGQHASDRGLQLHLLSLECAPSPTAAPIPMRHHRDLGLGLRRRRPPRPSRTRCTPTRHHRARHDFDVTLTVTDDDGDTDAVDQEVTVAPAGQTLRRRQGTLRCLTLTDAMRRVTVTLTSRRLHRGRQHPDHHRAGPDTTVFDDGCNTPDGDQLRSERWRGQCSPPAPTIVPR